MRSEKRSSGHGWQRLGEGLCDGQIETGAGLNLSPGPLSPSIRSADSVRLCPHCGREQRTVPISVPWRDRIDYWWATCPCQAAVWAEDERAQARMAAHYHQRHKEEQLAHENLRRIAHFTLDSFEPGLLTSDTREEHPYTIATTWFDRIWGHPHGNYRDPAAPPAALFFYSPGKGRGKSHLGAALANLAAAKGKRVAFVEEHAFLQARWGRPIAEAEQFTEYIGEQTWLTVIDDLGQRAKATPSVADAWYALFNRRSMQARWTIITSNLTPDELLAQGTINDATYSRLAQMIGLQIITFHGSDQRLR